MNLKYKFDDCSCEIDLINETIKENDGLPSLQIPYEQMFIGLNYGKVCPKVWPLLAQGYTKGVFQLETNFAKSWTTKLEPDSLDEIAALGALLRPGPLESIVDGKSMTQHYIDRTHKREEVTNIHDS